MKALLKFLQSWRSHSHTVCNSISDDATTLTFERLSRPEQDTVRSYFYAAANVMKACNSIRHQHRAMDVDEALLAFRDAESRYVQAGFQPFFPPAIQLMREFSPKELARANLLHRVEPSEKVQMFSPTMTRFVRKLIVTCRASVLHASDFDHLMNPQH